MTKNNGEFIGVKHFDELVSAIHGRVSEFVGESNDYEEEFLLENYKSEFEALAKHVRGFAEAHDYKQRSNFALGSVVTDVLKVVIEDIKTIQHNKTKGKLSAATKLTN